MYAVDWFGVAYGVLGFITGTFLYWYLAKPKKRKAIMLSDQRYFGDKLFPIEIEIIEETDSAFLVKYIASNSSFAGTMDSIRHVAGSKEWVSKTDPMHRIEHYYAKKLFHVDPTPAPAPQINEAEKVLIESQSDQDKSIQKLVGE